MAVASGLASAVIGAVTSLLVDAVADIELTAEAWVIFEA